MRKPAFWIAFALLSLAAVFVGVRYFPKAFSIVALDITMDRGRALDEARAIAARERLGPADFSQAASFSGDQEAQTFVELEGGGKDTFTRMLRDNLYAAYSWRVRHFKEGETNESTIRFTPDGRPYGFEEKLKEDAPGAALDAAAARDDRRARRRPRAGTSTSRATRSPNRDRNGARQAGSITRSPTSARTSPSTKDASG